MASSGQYVVCYDISDDDERRKVAKVLEGYGLRVQASVFEARLNKSMKRNLEKSLEGLEIATGYIFVYRLNTNSKRIGIGDVPEGIGEETYAFVV